MPIMTENERIDNIISKRFEQFMKRFGIATLLRKVGAVKKKGTTTTTLFTYLLGLVFTRKNLYESMTSNREQPSFGKNAVYRFLSIATVNWKVLVRRLAKSVIPEVNRLTSEARKTALIIDDTSYWRNRSKKVEMLSRCYDHSENKYYKGFTMLNLGWSDGQTFMPVDFRLLSSGKDENLLEGSRIKEDRRTLATKRRMESRIEKPVLSLQMLRDAKGTPVQAQYVLFDSWFASPSFIMSVKGLGYDAVARLKNHENFRYLWGGDKQSMSQIYRAGTKRKGRSRYLLSAIVEIQHKDFESTVPAKIVYVRDRNNRKKWIALISTDISLSEDEIVALYAKRWDIEPFHKVLKSTLYLTTEFQLRTFDSIVAHTAIVLVRYMFLSLESRENKDERSVGELFLSTVEELEDISFQFAFELLLVLLEQCLYDFDFIPSDHVNRVIGHFIACLPWFIKDRLVA